MESNKSIHRSDKQKNLYKALVDAYESDKLILDTYGDTVLFKRCRDDEDKDEEPSAGSNQGSKKRRAGKEPESTSAPKEKTSNTSDKSYEGSKSQHKSASESSQTEDLMNTTKDLEEPRLTKLPSPDYDWNKTLPNAHGPVQPWLSSLAEKEDPRESFNELIDTPLDFSAFVMNRLNVYTLTPELLTGPTFELMKGSCKSLITVHRDDDKLYKFNDFNRLRIQDIEDMLLLLVQGKLINLTVEERLAFNVSLRMFTRSVVIQRRVEDLQLGFIYQNKHKKNRLMRIDELHKFSDGTLNDVRTALNDRLKGIRIEYLPQTIWRQSDKDKAEAMIQAIDKQLKTRRIMESLEKFVGGRPYEGIGMIKRRKSENRDNATEMGASTGIYLNSVSYKVSVCIEENIRVISFTMKMEILLEPTSNKLMVGNGSTSVRVHLIGSLIPCCLLRDASVMRTASAAAKPCQGDSS
ncbi:hypothetical protein Tco_1311660 [Tanacetum coccineum]